MVSGIDTIYVIYAAAALAAILVAEAGYLLFAGGRDKRVAINRRMRLQEKKITQQEVLLLLRKERGLGSGGLPLLGALGRLRTQSGVSMPMPRFLLFTGGACLGMALLALWLGVPVKVVLVALPLLVPCLPVMVLRYLRKRRHKLFGLQLPEALELITRSLKAGHPVPVAISMVAREMPDPIGTEFGVVSDEVTFGAELVAALHSMYQRVGHEDLPLFVTAVSIQASSGGNLREVLEGLAATIRERGKLRRKVRAISAEGRMSAYVLTAVPALLMAAIMALMPRFYESVWHVPLTWYLLGGSVGWLVLGNVMMFKMANFRF